MDDMPRSMADVLTSLKSYNLKSRDDRLNNHPKFVYMIENIPMDLLGQLVQEVSKENSAYSSYMNGYDVTAVFIAHRNRSSENPANEKDKTA